MKIHLLSYLIFLFAPNACKPNKKNDTDTLKAFNQQKSHIYFGDTFSLANNLFRFKHNIHDNDLEKDTTTLQQFTYKYWSTTKLALGYQMYDSIRHVKDINGDGFIDITNDTRFTQDVYFFDPIRNLFLDSSTAEINPDWILLDKSKKIFCDFQPFKGMGGQIHSNLYTFKNFARYDLYQLELWNQLKDSANLIPKLILSKCVNGNADSLQKITAIILSKPIDTDADEINWTKINGEPHYFDYVAFWKKRYKKLLPNL